MTLPEQNLFRPLATWLPGALGLAALGLPAPSSHFGAQDRPLAGPPGRAGREAGRGPRRGRSAAARPGPAAGGWSERGPEVAPGGGAVSAACRKWPWAGVRAAPAVSRVPPAGDAMEPGAAELYDQALLGILQHVGNVQDFLRVLFGFLYRKTDFYRLLRHPSDRMGFPPGAAQALVLQVTRGGRLGPGAGWGWGRRSPASVSPRAPPPGPASRGRACE